MFTAMRRASATRSRGDWPGKALLRGCNDFNSLIAIHKTGHCEEYLYGIGSLCSVRPFYFTWLSDQRLPGRNGRYAAAELDQSQSRPACLAGPRGWNGVVLAICGVGCGREALSGSCRERAWPGGLA